MSVDATTVNASAIRRSWPCCSGARYAAPNSPGLTVEQIQQRDGCWVVVDLVGKGGWVRTNGAIETEWTRRGSIAGASGALSIAAGAFGVPVATAVDACW